MSKNLGWGALCLHINCLEMMAVFQALRTLLPALKGYLFVRSTTTLVDFINLQGSLRLLSLTKWQDTSSSGLLEDSAGPQMAEGPPVRLSSGRSAPSGKQTGKRDWMLRATGSSSCGSSTGYSCHRQLREVLLSQARGSLLHPQPELWSLCSSP